MYDWERTRQPNEVNERLYLMRETARGYYIKIYDHPDEKEVYLSKKVAFNTNYGGLRGHYEKSYCMDFYIDKKVYNNIDKGHPDYAKFESIQKLISSLRAKFGCKKKTCKWSYCGWEIMSGLGVDTRWSCDTCSANAVVLMRRRHPVFDVKGIPVGGIEFGKVYKRKTYIDAQKRRGYN